MQGCYPTGHGTYGNDSVTSIGAALESPFVLIWLFRKLSKPEQPTAHCSAALFRSVFARSETGESMRYGYARVSGSSQDYRVQIENLKPADLRVLSPAGHLGLNGHFENETLRFNTQCPRAATLQEARLM